MDIHNSIMDIHHYNALVPTSLTTTVVRFLSVPGIHCDRISSLTSKKSSSLCLAAAVSITSLARPSTCSLVAIFDTCSGCRSSVIVTSYLLASKLASDTCIYEYP